MDAAALRPAVSKNLFENKYKNAGAVDEDIKPDHDMFFEAMKSMEGEMKIDQQDKIDEYKEFCAMELSQAAQQEDYQKAVTECDTQEIMIPIGHGNLYPIRMLVHTPNTLKGKKGQVPFFSIHGGGAIAGSIDLHKPFACLQATKLNAVVFNPMYMLAGTKYGIPGRLSTAEEMANGIIAAIKYVHQNADQYGVDASKLVMEGGSGGGYAISAVCGRLAMLGQSNLVKLAVLTQAVDIGYYFAVKKEDMPTEEAKMCFYDAPFVGHGYASDFDKQWQEKDPVLFPHQASEEVLKKWPPTILISSEYDNYDAAVQVFMPRLKSAGRLLEFICYPGANHGFMYGIGQYKRALSFWDDLVQIKAEYVD